MAKKRLCEMMVVTHKGGWANRQDERRNKNGEVMDYHVSYLEVEWSGNGYFSILSCPCPWPQLDAWYFQKYAYVKV